MERTEMLARLADMLDYPGDGFHSMCDTLSADLAGSAGGAAADEFRAAVAGLPLERLQEIYAATFDLNPACCLYAGYHLFGDSYKRGALMAKLNAEYCSRGYDPGNELPDHLTVLLRFLADLDDAGLRSELLEELVLPALDRIVKSFAGTSNIYARLAKAATLGLSPEGYAPRRELSRSLPVLEPDESLVRG
jgi:nitrate reductase delta subunit